MTAAFTERVLRYADIVHKLNDVTNQIEQTRFEQKCHTERLAKLAEKHDRLSEEANTALAEIKNSFSEFLVDVEAIIAGASE